MKAPFVLALVLVSALAWASAGVTPVSLQSNVAAVGATVQDTVARAAEKRKKKVKKEKPKTRVLMAREVTRATLSKRDDIGDNIEIVIVSGGIPIRNPEDMQMIGSSGHSEMSSSYIGFDDVSLPFEGNIRFKAPNKLKTAVYDREVRFVVDEPGKWVLKVDI